MKQRILAAAFLLLPAAALAQTSDVKAYQPESVSGNYFVPGNIVVDVEGCGVRGGTCSNVPGGTGTNDGYGDNQAAPITLFQYNPAGATTSATYVNSLQLPVNASGGNYAISGEYGSSSEGSIQLSGDTRYITVMGYGVNKDAFNTGGAAVYGTAALAQSTSVTSQTTYTPVPRLAMFVDANGNVNSATGVYNVFDQNNPRSMYSATGATAWISGQGNSPDATGGVFYITAGSTVNAPTPITGNDTNSKTSSQDTRFVTVYNNTLYVSVDSKEGSGSNRSFVGTLGTPPATSLYNSNAGPTQLTGFGTSNAGKYTITSGSNSNGNGLNTGIQINLSPENYFFANPATLYVADSGAPKNNSSVSSGNSVGNGGLQKWTNSKSDGSGTWTLAYTLHSNLPLVSQLTNTSGVSGLLGLAGVVSGSNVLLYSTSYVLADTDPTYLYGITDNINYTTATQAASETFTKLDTAPSDSKFGGVTFAPSFPAGNVEITTVPSGLVVTTAGTGCAAGTYIAPITLAFTPASSCQLTATTPQAGTTGTRYAFAHWSDGTTNPTDTVTAPSSTAIYTATFNTQYLVSTSATAGGTVSAGGYYTAGTSATVTATPNAGYHFVNFTGSEGTSSSNPFTFTVNGPVSVVANFAADSITFSSVSHNMGSVAVGSTAPVYGVYMTNNTSQTLNFGVAFSNPNAGFFESSAKTLAPGASTELNFGFKPTATGTVSTTWSLTGIPNGIAFSPSNGGTLTGTGTSAAHVTITTNGHNFGTVAVGQTSSVFGAVITNGTSSPVTLSVGSTSAPFHQYLNNCPATLAAGATCNVQWTFTPTGSGTVSTTVPLNSSSTIYFGSTAVTGMYLAGTGNIPQ